MSSSELAIKGSTFVMQAKPQEARRAEHPSLRYRDIKSSIGVNREELQYAWKFNADVARRIIERTLFRLGLEKTELKKVLVGMAKKA